MAISVYSPPPPILKLPPIEDLPLTPPTSPQQALFADAHRPVDWLDFCRERSARDIAEKTCEMICYLWFRSSPLQLQVTHTFITFLQKLLETTQVSQSVIVLSLHYIYRLKERNRWTPAQEGSEFRIAVAGLMMANKFLDDNTYTNKTWSEVSGISLAEINRMEREFLLGVDFDLYVSKPTYESWLNLLKGLVWAKERDARKLGKKKRTTATRRHHRVAVRARSTSPAHPPPGFEDSSPTKVYSHCLGTKRTAETAFSPTSASFSSVPSKRPVSMILSIPETQSRFPQPSSWSPLETSLQNMSIDSPQFEDDVAPLTRRVLPSERTRMVETARAPPGRLYFWTAASRTPTEDRAERVLSPRQKARLRYHHSTSNTYSYQPPPPPPVYTIPQANSAQTSPVWRLPPLQSFDFHLQSQQSQHPQPQFTYVYPHPSEFEYEMKGTPPSRHVRILEEMVQGW